MRAWWVFWVTIGIAAALWIGVPLVGGREAFRNALGQPVWLSILLAPLAAAGVNLIAFRASHEEVCRYEAERHRWLRAIVGRGYSSRMFASTGVVFLVVVVLLIVAKLVGGL